MADRRRIAQGVRIAAQGPVTHTPRREHVGKTAALSHTEDDDVARFAEFAPKPRHRMPEPLPVPVEPAAMGWTEPPTPDDADQSVDGGERGNTSQLNTSVASTASSTTRAKRKTREVASRFMIPKQPPPQDIIRRVNRSVAVEEIRGSHENSYNDAIGRGSIKGSRKEVNGGAAKTPSLWAGEAPMIAQASPRIRPSASATPRSARGSARAQSAAHARPLTEEQELERGFAADFGRGVRHLPDANISPGRRASDISTRRPRAPSESERRASSANMLPRPASKKPTTAPTAPLPIPVSRKPGAITSADAKSEQFVGLLHARLTQWCYANARAQATFAEQEAKAMDQLHAAWTRVEDTRTKIQERRMRLQDLRHASKVDEVASVQALGLSMVDEALPAAAAGHADLTRALGATTVHMPVHTVNLQADALTDAMRAARAKLDGINEKLLGTTDQANSFAELLRVLSECAQDEASNLSQSREALLALAALESWERSLRVQQIQEAAMGLA